MTRKGVIIRGLGGGCSTAAHRVTGQIFRGYVQLVDNAPGPGHVMEWIGYPAGEQYVPSGLPNYRVQDFDFGRIILIIGSNSYTVEAWPDSGPRMLYRQWPKTDFP